MISRAAWSAVGLCALLALLWPVVVRRVSPTYACEAAWHRARAALPVIVPPLGPGDLADSSDGTAWIASSRALASRESPEDRDPWGRRWLFAVGPVEEDDDWRRFVEHEREHPPPRWWARLAGGLVLRPYSRGPDGVDQAGAGDDVVMKPLLGGKTSRGWALLGAVAYGREYLVGLAALLAWVLLAWRAARAPYRSPAREALTSALLLSLPAAAIVAACLALARELRRSELIATATERAVLAPELAVAGTLALAAYLGLLAWRLRRARRGSGGQ